MMSTTQSPVLTISPDHFVQLETVSRQVSQYDAEGRFWPRFLISDLKSLIADDPRYDFLNRLSRSAHFGQMLAGEYEFQRFGCRTEKVRLMGFLLNLFVTSFDSICDEIPELLPETLPHIGKIVTSFPAPAEGISIRRNLSGLSLSIAQSWTELIAKSIQNLPDESRHQIVNLTKKAYASQLSDLSVTADDVKDADQRIESKSTGPFAVILAGVHALHGDVSDLSSVEQIAMAMGRAFGWVDDLVDWQEDARKEKPTSVSLFLIPEKPTRQVMLDKAQKLRKETEKRVDALKEILFSNGLNGMMIPLSNVYADWLTNAEM